MKTLKSYPFTLILSFILLYGCQQNSQEITDQERQDIINELEQLWEFSLDGVEQQNAEQTFSNFSKMEGTKYIRNGYIYPSIETAKNEYASWWSAPDAIKLKGTWKM
jgi:hypothetical protein